MAHAHHQNDDGGDEYETALRQRKAEADGGDDPGADGEEQTLFIKQLREKNPESKNMQDAAVGLYLEARSEGDATKQREAVKRFTEAIGGDPDAAISQEEVVKKMTKEQIDHAHELIADYKVWMYPFR